MHITKYDRTAAYHILWHNEPSSMRMKRDNVNAEATRCNYNLAKTDKNGVVELREILSSEDVYCSPRKDVNIICSCILTAPQNLPTEREKEFFSSAFDFFRDRYNTSPCVSAWVHLDEEGRHHLHYVFVPLVWDTKKDRWKVRAADIINREDLQSLHIDFKTFIDEKMHLNLEILNGATESGNKTVQELKNKTLQEEITKKQKEVKLLKRIKTKLQDSILYDLSR